MSRDSILGGTATAGSFLFWGLVPIYWKQVSDVPSVEITAHRIVWTLVLMLPVLIALRRLPELAAEFRSFRQLFLHGLRASLLASNWLFYLYAVATDRLLDASLGYFLVPLINVALGFLILKEKLSLWKWISVALAAVGVSVLTLHHGQLPWLALGMAFSFGFYGLLRKRAEVGSIPGLTIESLILSVPALFFLTWWGVRGEGVFLEVGLRTHLFLVGGGVITAIPLLLFAYGARRINLTTVGLFQYLAPTVTFVLGLFIYGEPFSRVQLAAFLCIWSALALYSAVSFSRRRLDPVIQAAG